MAITVKKSSSPKTLRVAPRADVGAPAEGSGPAVDFSPPESVSGPRKRSYTLDIVLGILACLVFGALIAVQAIEWKFYEQPPQRAFPVFLAEGSLSMGQQWAAAPIGIQVALVIGVLMLVLGLVAMTMLFMMSIKAKGEVMA